MMRASICRNQLMKKKLKQGQKYQHERTEENHRMI